MRYALDSRCVTRMGNLDAVSGNTAQEYVHAAGLLIKSGEKERGGRSAWNESI